MAITACKDCKTGISTDAKNCPHCGASNAKAYRGVRLGGLVYLAIIATAFYWIWGLMTPTPHGQTMTSTDVGDSWPFTVDEVELLCEGPPPMALAKVDGKIYALSGSARSKAQERGWLDGQLITKSRAEMPEMKMDYSFVVSRAQALCGA